MTPAQQQALSALRGGWRKRCTRLLRGHGVSEGSVEIVWDAIALHTTPGVPEYKKPEVALVTSGVEMDALGIAYDQFTPEQRQAPASREASSTRFYEGMKHRTDSTFGTVNDDVERRYEFAEPLRSVEGRLFALRRVMQECEGYLRGRDRAIQRGDLTLQHGESRCVRSDTNNAASSSSLSATSPLARVSPSACAACT
jgi:hypothetical protein